MANTKRVQVLMEPADFARLNTLAEQRGISLAELIREALFDRYFAAESHKKAAADALVSLGLPGLAAAHLESTVSVARTGDPV